jgi:ubiquinone/menaquinone biosynthesis C-methylase UbiE
MMMRSDKNLLNHYGKINAGFLHAYGKAGTEKLLQLIDFKKDDLVLEIGFGTGTTLVKIISRKKDVRLHGIEQSQIMFKKARQRIKYGSLNNSIFLKKVEQGQIFPFADNFFDKVIIESVLAIQEDLSLHFLLSEIKRVLKPSGIFYLNETVWLPSISQQEIESINSYCKKMFGIIQSNSTYKYRQEWIELLENYFNVQKLKPIAEIEVTFKDKQKAVTSEFFSKLYSLYGKIKGRLNKSLRRESGFYKEAMKNIFDDKQYLEGIIFVMQKD